MKKTLLLALAFGVPGSTCLAAISFTGAAITEDFTGYDGNSAPAGWDADGFSTGPGFSENRGASSGGVTTGGTYAFDIGGGNTALGVQPGGSDFTPGYYQLEVTNNSGGTITLWTVSFNSYYFNDADRGNTFNFSYSTDGSVFTAVPAGGFASPTPSDASPAWTLGAAYADDLAAPVANGGSLFLRWTGDDSGGSGSRDEFALDDVSVSGIPEPSSAALLGLASLALLRRRRS